MMRLSHATDATLPSTFPRPIFLPPIPRPSSDPSLSSLSALPSCAPRVFVLLSGLLSLARPHLFRFFLSFFLPFFYFDRQRALVMHLNNLFISDSTLRATRALVIMRGKHSRVWERVGRFLSLGFCVSPSFRASTIDVVEDRNTRIVSRILIKW